MKKNIFSSVAANHPSLNHFDLSYTNTGTYSFGYLYPVQCDEVYPGDVFKMSAYVHAELMPMLAPVMSDIQIFAHVFFCPFRLLYGVDNADGASIWEKFITGGKDGDYETPLPSWSPTFSKVGFSSKTIWDSIGLPMSYDKDTNTWTPVVPDTTRIAVSVAPRLAYNSIWNSFYRDESLQDEVALSNEDLLQVSFKKDYFTSALTAQQRGTAPALPVDISGIAPVVFASDGIGSNNPLQLNPTTAIWAKFGSDESGKFGISNTTIDSDPSYTSAAFFKGSVSGSSFQANTFNVSDLRLTFAIQSCSARACAGLQMSNEGQRH